MPTASKLDSQAVREARASFRRGDLAMSESQYRKAVADAPEDPAALVGLARAEYLRGKKARALELLDRAEKAVPGGAEALSARAVIVEADGDPVLALDLCRRAARSDPRLFEARFNAGRLLARNGRWAEAVAEYRQAVALEPANALAELQLGAALIEAQAADEGLRHMMRAIELAPKSVEGYLLLSDLLARIGRTDASEKVLAAAARNLPGSRAVIERLIVIAERRLDLGRARDLARELVAAAVKEAGAWRRLGLLELAAGAPLEAEKCAKKARTLAPKDPEMHFALGVIYEAMKLWEPAAAAYRKAVEVGPKHWGAMTNLGRILATEKKPALEEALKLQKKARALAPEEAAPALNLALAFEAKGEKAKAAESARAVLALAGAPAAAKAQAKRVIARSEK